MDHNDTDFVLLDASETGDINQNNEPLTPSQVARITAWLQPTDFAATSSEYGKHRTSHLAGTGSWIFEAPQYLHWHASASGTLWIKGAAGSGKSVIAASLTSKLVQEEKAPVLYFFFRHIVSANRKPLSMIRDFMAQLLPHSPQLQHALNTLLEQQRSLDTMASTEMWGLLVTSLLPLPRIYCIVDGLDEMEIGNEAFIGDLVALGRRRPKAIKIMMTSRPVPRVERFLRHESVTTIHLNPKQIRPDIDYYLEHRVAGLTVSSSMRSQIRQAIYDRSGGYFLYARLMMDEISKLSENSKTPEQDLTLALGRLPTSIAAMYSKLLGDHSRQTRTTQVLQVSLLQWVTQAERPLRLLELSALIAFGETSEALSGHKEKVRHGCGPLLEILADETICPIHHSLIEFLYDQDRRHNEETVKTFPILDQKDAHRSIALACIKALKTDWFIEWDNAPRNQNQTLNQTKINTFKAEHAFLDYAANNWYMHVRKSDADDETVCNEVYDFLAGDSRLFRAWIEIVTPISTDHMQLRSLTSSWTPLHVVADKGLARIAEFLINRGADIEVKDYEKRTPMILAARGGYTRTVETLLQLGAKNDEADNNGFTPLHHAAMCNNVSTVAVLLETGINLYPSQPGRIPDQRLPYTMYTCLGNSPVLYACQNGHVDVVKAFLPHLYIESIYQAMSWAWQRFQFEVVAILLDSPGIDANRYEDDRTLFFCASEARDTQAMRRLIEMGADVHKLSLPNSNRFGASARSAANSSNLTPLHGFVCGGKSMACRWDLTQVLEGLTILLDAGIDVNSVDSAGWTILHHLMACTGSDRSSHTRKNELGTVLSMLLERGMSATSITAEGANALTLAVNVSAPAIDLLAKRGLDINETDKDGLNPLTRALRRKDLLLARILLDKGADPNFQDRDGNTPMHLLAKDILEKDYRNQGEGLELARRLVEAGANVCARNREGNTALHFFTRKATLLNLFLEQGFDLEAKNNAGETVLYLAVEGLEYQAFVDAGANPRTHDAEGRSILHRVVGWAMNHLLVDMLRYFVDKGNSLSVTDNSGNSLWHTIAWRSSCGPQDLGNALDFLYDSGLSPTEPNHAGRTPFHIACSINPTKWSNNQALHFFMDKGIDVDAGDHDGITPLHIAISLSSQISARLLEFGADLRVTTNEGQTVLMTACRARQCDRVCLLLDYYKERQLLPLVDQVDDVGRSALHYACRSGRPESVALLIDAGADINIRDNNGLTPLHVCTEYLLEKKLWEDAQPKNKDKNLEIDEYPTYISRKENIRPTSGFNPEVHFRIRASIRLLIANGAETSFLIRPLEQTSRLDPLSMAINAGCDVMVNELLAVRQTLLTLSDNAGSLLTSVKTEKGNGSLGSLNDGANYIAEGEVTDVNLTPINIGEYTINSVHGLLKDEDEPLVEELVRQELRSEPISWRINDAITKMVRFGFTDLVRKFGRDAAQIGILGSCEHSSMANRQDQPQSMLMVALNRELPDMETVKLLVSDFKTDISAQHCDLSLRGEKNFLHPIHRVARAQYWWHTRALEFLLSQGCDVEARNSGGETALVVAVQQGFLNRIEDAITRRTVSILLQHGAKFDALSWDGKSCLSIAANRPKLFRLLLDRGADPHEGQPSVLSDAIITQKVEIIRLLLEAKVDVNRRPRVNPSQAHKFEKFQKMIKPDFPHVSNGDIRKRESHVVDVFHFAANAFPIHLAAGHSFNRPEYYATAVPIINMLLEAGADPWLSYDSKISILHSLAEQGGIIEPILKRGYLDLERRDFLGRTILLAACDSSPDYFSRGSAENPPLLIKMGASISAVDHRGRNALHCLLDACPEKNERSRPTALDSITSDLAPALVTRPDNQGRTVFQYALSNFHFHLIDLFLTHGASPWGYDPVDGTTPLHHLAARLASYDDLRLWDPKILTLSDVSTDTDTTLLSSGLTARAYLLEKGVLDAASLEKSDIGSPGRHFRNFLRHGLSINVQDFSGETPLLKFAAEAPRGLIDQGVKSTLLSVMTLFEDAGADFTIRNVDGESVLHKLAVHSAFLGQYLEKESIMEDLQRVVTWLVSKGVDVSWEDTKSRTCLDIAASSGAQWMLDMFSERRIQEGVGAQK